MRSALDPLRRALAVVRRGAHSARAGRDSAFSVRGLQAGWVAARAGDVPLRVLVCGAPGAAALLAGMGHSVTSLDAAAQIDHGRLRFLRGELASARFEERFDLVALFGADARTIETGRRLLAPDGRLLAAFDRAAAVPEGRHAAAFWKLDGNAWTACDRAEATAAARNAGCAELTPLATSCPTQANVAPLALVSSFKPFRGVDAENQAAALASWRRAGLQVVVAGDEIRGAPDIRGLRIVDDVRRARDVGTAAPYLRAIVEAGLAHSDGPWLCLTNADIVLGPDFAARVARLVQRHGPSAIFAVRRRNLHAHRPELLAHWPPPRSEWDLFSPMSSDLFITSREMWRTILDVLPDFVFGRVQWDNWMHCAMVRLGKPVDASWALPAFHLPHGYEIQQAESAEAASHTATAADLHNRRLFRESPLRIGEAGELHLGQHWFAAEDARDWV